MSAAPRILHAPADVGGNAYGLSRAERRLGYVSDVAVFDAGPFGYAADLDLHLAGSSRVRQTAVRLQFLRRALRDYDIFHFNFGQTLFTVHQLGRAYNELAWLRRAGKTIVATFQGCDVRPQECCFCEKPTCRAWNRYRLPNAERTCRLAHRVHHLNPDLGQWLPGSTFMPYANVDPRELHAHPLPDRGEVVVAHAPTDRAVKGTADLLTAIEQLQGDGLAIRLDLIEGVTHDEVRRRLVDADVVVDQLRLGWYGGLAVEAMSLGRPVVCYIRDDERSPNPFRDELPIVSVTPETLAGELRRLAADRPARVELGARSRRFAEVHHDPDRIARDYLAGLGFTAPSP